jgi:hypothetical protein
MMMLLTIYADIIQDRVSDVNDVSPSGGPVSAADNDDVINRQHEHEHDAVDYMESYIPNFDKCKGEKLRIGWFEDKHENANHKKSDGRFID